MFYSVFHVDFSVGKENHFFFCIITCDQKRVSFGYTRRTLQWVDVDKAQTKLQESASKQLKVITEHDGCRLVTKRQTKTITAPQKAVWSAKGVIHYSFLQEGKAVAVTSYGWQIDYLLSKVKHETSQISEWRMAQFCCIIIPGLRLLQLRSTSCKAWFVKSWIIHLIPLISFLLIITHLNTSSLLCPIKHSKIKKW